MKTFVFALLLAMLSLTPCEQTSCQKSTLLTTRKQLVTVALTPDPETWAVPNGVPEWAFAPSEENPPFTLSVNSGGMSAWVIPDTEAGTCTIIVTIPMRDWWNNPLPDYVCEFEVTTFETIPWRPLTFEFGEQVPK